MIRAESDNERYVNLQVTDSMRLASARDYEQEHSAG
jgi:hypothetical protein